MHDDHFNTTVIFNGKGNGKLSAKPENLFLVTSYKPPIESKLRNYNVFFYVWFLSPSLQRWTFLIGFSPNQVQDSQNKGTPPNHYLRPFLRGWCVAIPDNFFDNNISQKNTPRSNFPSQKFEQGKPVQLNGFSLCLIFFNVFH